MPKRPMTILLTGFGPFPGVPENVSASLVEALAPLAQARFHDIIFHHVILPTEWQLGVEMVQTALRSLKPDIVIHFGVSSKARGFVLERCAANACVASIDGAGQLPPLQVLALDGPEELSVTLPLDAMFARLTLEGIPVALSCDAGAYLCNAVLYGSLYSAAATKRGMQVGFVHIPHSLPETPTDTQLLTMRQALAGSLAMIAVCCAGM